MAYKTFVDGEVFYGPDVMTYLMKQVVVACTAATRPASPPEGMVVFETDTDKVMLYDGSSWVEVWRAGEWEAYTPVWTSTGTAPSLGNGILTGSYARWGRMVQVRIALTIGSTTTTGTGVYRFSLPVAPKVGSLLTVTCEDVSAGSVRWAGAAYLGLESTTGDNMRITVTAGSTGVGSTVPFTWANGDKFWMAGTYEAAS